MRHPTPAIRRRGSLPGPPTALSHASALLSIRLLTVFVVPSVAAQQRVVGVVYDDSGSMGNPRK
jgi:hypothetical protein